VSSDRELLLLDTNIVIHLIRGNEVARRVEGLFHLRHRLERPLISVVTVAEGLALARQFGWGERTTAELEELFNEFLIVDVHQERILRAYAEIADFARRHGRTLAHNDIWIAATAVATGAHLITADRDFDPLDPEFLKRTWIDPGG
jgi:tRNA(fMet)-specific endonuclease VapC